LRFTAVLRASRTIVDRIVGRDIDGEGRALTTWSSRQPLFLFSEYITCIDLQVTTVIDNFSTFNRTAASNKGTEVLNALLWIVFVHKKLGCRRDAARVLRACRSAS